MSCCAYYHEGFWFGLAGAIKGGKRPPGGAVHFLYSSAGSLVRSDPAALASRCVCAALKDDGYMWVLAPCYGIRHNRVLAWSEARQ